MVECPICYEDVRIPSCIRPCSHMFCHKCINQWLKKNPACPVCRTECDIEKFKVEKEPATGYFSSDKSLYLLTSIMGIR